MNINIKHLHPNPFRDIDNYPMDAEKINALKESIDQTGFWDNIVVRPTEGWVIVNDKHEYAKYNDGDYENAELPCVRWYNDGEFPDDESFEIAYGHHRLEALRQLGVETVDLPVKDLDDATMLQIMAHENRSEYSSSPLVLVETVRAVKDFLDGELIKYDSFNSAHEFMSSLGIDSQASFGAAKKGVGEETIHKFLGSSWSKWEIQGALAQIKAEQKSPAAKEVLKKMPSVAHVKNFNAAIKKAEKEGVQFSDDEKLDMAKGMAADETSKRNVAPVIERAAFEKKHADIKNKKAQKQDGKQLQRYELFILESTDKVRQVRTILNVLDQTKNEFKQVNKQNVVSRGILINELNRLVDKINSLTEFLKQQ